MTRTLLSLSLLLLLPAFLHAQAISINTDASNPDPSAILDVKSTEKGMLVPRMSTAQRTTIAAPATGLLVFDTGTGGFWFYNGAAWANLSGGGTPATFIADTDNNTKVQTEEAPNEDIIRFDIGGIEKMLLRQNAHGAARLELPDVANSTHIGVGAGQKNVPVVGVSGYDNTFLGYNSGTTNTDGYCNTFLGSRAGQNNISGADNTAVGVTALYRNTDRSGLVAVGDSALYNNGLGATSYQATNNTAIGSKALFSNTKGAFNTATGYLALYSNTTASNNTANGIHALFSNTTGSFNTANGADALFSNTTGYQNTANGLNTLRYNNTGFDNTAIGADALLSNTEGDLNTAIGFLTLNHNATGSKNTAVGYDADVASGDLTNASAIGASAVVGCSNCLVLGSINGVKYATSSVNVGIGTTTPTERLEVAAGNIYATDGDFYTGANAGVINTGGGIMNPNVNIIADANPTLNNVNGDEDLYIGDDLELGGQGYKPGGGAWATASDARLKKDVTPYTDGLAQVLQIKPVRYRYNDVIRFHDGDKTYVGVLAQDMAKVAPYMVELTPFGQKVTEDEHGNEHITDPGTLYYTYDGTALTYMLVNAVQEQQTEIETLKAENNALKAQLEAQKAQIDAQAAVLQKITAALRTAGIGVEEK